MSSSRRTLTITATAAALVAAALLGNPARAVTPAALGLPEGTVEGTIVQDHTDDPKLMLNLTYAQVAGEVYVGLDEALDLDQVVNRTSIVRLRDGLPVRTHEQPTGSSSALTGSSLVASTSSADATTYSYADPVSGDVRGSRVVPRGTTYLTGDVSWALLRRSRTGGGSDVVLERAGLPALVLAPGTASLRARALDARIALLRRDDDYSWVDVVDGTLTPVPGAGELASCSAERCYRKTALEAGGTHVTWSERTSSTHGAVDVNVPPTTWMLPYGQGLALFTAAGLVPVDLTDGSLGAPLTTQLRSMWAMPGGTLVVQDLAGTVRAFSPGRPAWVVWRRPAISGELHDGVMIGSDHLAVQASLPPGDRYVDLPAADVWHTGTADDPIVGKVLDLGGRLAVSAVARRLDGLPSRLRVTFPGGHRELDAVDATLEPGGWLLTVQTADGGSYEEEAISGRRVTRPSASTGGSGAVDGSTVWWAPAGARVGELASADLSAPGTPASVVHTGLTCPVRRFWGAAGRWLVVECEEGANVAGRSWVVDARGVLAPWPVPEGWIVGVLDGLLVQRRVGSGHPWLAVTDLADHTETTFGPLSRGASSDYDVDRVSRRLAYLDAGSQARWVQLPAASPVPAGTPDLTAPTAHVEAPAGEVVSGAPLRVSWSAVDPQGGPGERVAHVDSFDVRYRQAAPGSAGFGAWVSPAAWQATTGTSASLPVANGATTCVQVRARDFAGNVGGWSDERCALADSVLPVVTSATVGPLVVPVVTASVVTFAYTARDDRGVASYDVQQRGAEPDGTSTGWTNPAGYLGRTGTSLQVTVPVGGWQCLRVRARDAAGNAGGWSPDQCVGVPRDDRALTAVRGPLVRGTTAMALGGTVTVLNGKGAQIGFVSTVGSRLGLVVLRGKGQGNVDVYVGGTRRARVSLAATAWRRDIVILPVGYLSGQVVRVVSVSSAPARVDAVAVLP